MEFLKEILGDDLYTQVKLCIEAYNSENSDNKIELVNGYKTENPERENDTAEEINVKENSLELGVNLQISYGDIMKMTYNERNRLYNENPEAYKNAINNIN